MSPSSTHTSSRTGALATPHALATEAGMRAYAEGGNAIDAAITAAAVLTVVYPHNVALGGDLIALVHTPDGTVSCVNASGWASELASAARLRAAHGAELPVRGAATVTVPGGVRGWESLRRFGARLSWERCLRPAQEAAEAGVPVARSLALHLAHPENADLRGTTDFDRVFGRPNGLLAFGDELRQPELAATLAALRERGPDHFYRGPLAERTRRFLAERGAVFTAADFADYAPEVTDPLALDFGGLRVLTSPPNTHGFVMLRALRGIAELGLSDPLGDHLDVVLELFRTGNAWRTQHLADPRFAPVDVPTMINDAPASFAEPRSLVAHGDTVGIAALDGDGYGVSLIQSVYHAFGSGLIDPVTGVLFHNRGMSFSLDEDSPNVIEPRKRPAHTLMPAMTLDMSRDRSRIRHVLSTMGGQGQPQILTQVLLRALAGASAQAAVAAPRAIVGTQTDGATADSVAIESDLGPVARAAVARLDVPVTEVPRHTEELGQTNVVFVGPDGAMTAASDPRADGSAVVTHYPRSACQPSP